MYQFPVADHVSNVFDLTLVFVVTLNGITT